MKYKITKLNTTDKTLRKKLLSFGLLPGTIIEIIRVAPLGDPVDIKIRGYHLSIRREELELLDLEQIK